MIVSRLLALAAEWRGEAERFRRLGAEQPARMSETHADDLEKRVREWQTEELTVAEAAAESGYSEERLRELVREGTLPDGRPPGSRGTIYLRRCDLPRRPSSNGVSEPVEALVEKVRAGRR